MAETTEIGAIRRIVLVYLAVNCAEMLSLGVAARVTDSVALRAQTAANAAEVAVEVFLLIGVLSSVRPPDDTHPLGYGRERFFWSLFAALSIFVGGSGLAFEEAVRAALHPSPVDLYRLAYLVLATTIALDAFALELALRPLRERAAGRGISLRHLLQRSTDPAGITVVVGGGCAVIGGFAAAMGLALSQVTGSPTPDTVASALISLLLLIASALLLRTNRGLLSRRGLPLPMLRDMAGIVAAQPGGRRCPGPVRCRDRAIQPDRERRRHLRRRSGRAGGGRYDHALRRRASRTLARNRVRLPHAGPQGSLAPFAPIHASAHRRQRIPGWDPRRTNYR